MMKTTHLWKKTMLRGSLAALVLAFDLSAQAQSPPKAVVVVRHGEDLSTWTTTREAQTAEWLQVAPNWPTYALPNGSTVTVQLHGLSPRGEAQAKFLGKSLPVIVTALGCAPITRVVTKRPSGVNENGSGVTPNPFDTVYPLIDSVDFKARGGSVVLINPQKKNNPIVDAELMKMLDPEATAGDSILEGTSGSTVLCWDAEGLWGENSGGSRPFDKNGILSIMSGPAIGAYLRRMDTELGGGCPGKAARVYVFVGRSETGPGTGQPQGFNCIVVDVLDPTQTNLNYALEITARLRVDANENMRIMWPEVGTRDPWKPWQPTP